MMKTNVLQYLIINSIIIFYGCSNNTTLKQEVELTKYSYYLIENYNLEIEKKQNKEFDLVIYISEYQDSNKIIVISNIIKKKIYCFSDYNYISKYNDKNIYIWGYDNLYFRKTQKYKKIENYSCKDTVLTNYDPIEWQVIYNNSNHVIDLYIIGKTNVDSLLKNAPLSP